jgi:hypothetical protein
MVTGYEVHRFNTKSIKTPIYKVKGIYIMRITDKRYPRKLKKKLKKEI